MTIKEANNLITILRKENETGTAQDPAFNLEWIRVLGDSIVSALAKRDDAELKKQKK